MMALETIKLYKVNADWVMTSQAFERFGDLRPPLVRRQGNRNSNKIYVKRLTRHNGRGICGVGVFGESHKTKKIRAGLIIAKWYGLICNSAELSEVIKLKEYENVLDNSIGFDVRDKRIQVAGRARWVMVGANDCIATKFNDGRHGVYSKQKSAVNAEFVLNWTKSGFPQISVVTTVAIEHGSQILVDYGDAYWKTRSI